MYNKITSYFFDIISGIQVFNSPKMPFYRKNQQKTPLYKGNNLFFA